MTLVVVCGLPGVGKTTVAEAVTERLDADLIRTDVVRKEMYADPEYTDEETRRVYDEVFERARAKLRRGTPVVLDGTFRRETQRTAASDLASSEDAGFDLVKVVCDESVVEHRIERRAGDESDADFEVYLLIRDSFEPIEIPHATVDNSDGLEETRAQVAEVLSSRVEGCH